MNACMLHTDISSLVTKMELRYQQAIKSNEPFSVLKKHYVELKQVKQALVANKTGLQPVPPNS